MIPKIIQYCWFGGKPLPELAQKCIESWKALLDKLRICGLMEYWLSDEYHDQAVEELNKVDWSKQSTKAKAQYEKPIWLLKAKRRFWQIGSNFKQKLIKCLRCKV